MNSICWKPSQGCGTVGELLKSLEGLPMDTPLKGQGSNKEAVVRYEQLKDDSDVKWVSVGDGGW